MGSGCCTSPGAHEAANDAKATPTSQAKEGEDAGKDTKEQAAEEAQAAMKPTSDAKAGGVGDALPLLDGVRGGEGKDCYFSWPGIHQREWNNIVAWVELFGHLDPEQAVFSTACIFLPSGDANFGKHSPNTYDDNGCCWCQKLYGAQQDWGCRWFELWQDRLRDAIKREQNLIAVYKRGEEGQGDGTPWSAFPVGFSTDAKGLGGSQRGEVAFASELLGGANFEKVDVDGASKRMMDKIFRNLGSSLSERGGISRFNAAVKECPAARFGLGELALYNVRFAAEEAQTFSEALQSLKGLAKLILSKNGLRVAGALALAKALPVGLTVLVIYDNEIGAEGAGALAQALPAGLKWLNLGSNGVGAEGARALAQALPAGLTMLKLFNNDVGAEGARALARALPAGLTALHLGGNHIGDQGARSLAQALPAGLKELSLGGNGIGAEGARALAQALPGGLEEFRLRGNQIGAEGAGALAQALPAGLKELDLLGNDIGDEGARALAQAGRANPHLCARYEVSDSGGDASLLD